MIHFLDLVNVPRRIDTTCRHATLDAPMKRFAAIIAFTLLPVAAAAQTTGVLATKRPTPGA